MDLQPPRPRVFLAALTAASLAWPAAAPALGSSGAYLAARSATIASDFEAAAGYYMRALALDSGNVMLMENAVTANLGMGRFDRALPIARRMVEGDTPSQVSNMVILASLAEAGDWGALLGTEGEGRSIGPLVDGLVAAWAELGGGRVAAALEAFDAVSEESGLQSFALYHKALALASVGDFEASDEIFSGRAAGPLAVSRRGVIAHAQVLSALDRNDSALELLKATFGSNPAPVFTAMAADLEAGQTLEWDVATSPREGIAEVFFSVAGALTGEAVPQYTILYARTAEYLDPTHIDAVLLSASLLEDMEQFELAVRAYQSVPEGDPSYVAAELGRAEALRKGGKADAAADTLQELAVAEPQMLMVQMALGDTLRRMERYGDAAPAYDRAIALIDAPEQQHWPVWFARGITRERTGNWAGAEADLRRALELSPGEPAVLNYLGYSLVEEHEKLDEALGLIEQALAARPGDGYITNSLGWVLYRLGRYAEAVAPMEEAAALMPVDPIINDHLGDVYWAVGRQTEARFQWRRALSFDPEEDEAVRIRRKLQVGLDAVLEEEGAEPIDLATDG